MQRIVDCYKEVPTVAVGLEDLRVACVERIEFMLKVQASLQRY